MLWSILVIQKHFRCFQDSPSLKTIWVSETFGWGLWSPKISYWGGFVCCVNFESHRPQNTYWPKVDKLFRSEAIGPSSWHRHMTLHMLFGTDLVQLSWLSPSFDDMEGVNDTLASLPLFFWGHRSLRLLMFSLVCWRFSCFILLYHILCSVYFRI